jgi:hypothetical protein
MDFQRNNFCRIWRSGAVRSISVSMDFPSVVSKIISAFLIKSVLPAEILNNKRGGACQQEKAGGNSGEPQSVTGSGVRI